MTAVSGPSMGWGSSFYAEGDDMLSGVLFLSIIADKYPSKHCTIKYISDNLVWSNRTMAIWNTTYHIQKLHFELNKLHKITSSFHWVKCHQDWSKNKEYLSIEAKLNIAADSYATKCQKDHDGAYFPILYEYQPSYRTKAMTSKYSHHLIHT